MNPHDPFLVTTKEKLRFEQQFNALGPQNGFVTGNQAKGFFLKSGLSPLILGQIWYACNLLIRYVSGSKFPMTLLYHSFSSFS
jgi:hypothetical protein